MASDTWRARTARAWTSRESIEVVPIILGIAAAFFIHLILSDSPAIRSSNPPAPAAFQAKQVLPERSAIAASPKSVRQSSHSNRARRHRRAHRGVASAATSPRPTPIAPASQAPVRSIPVSARPAPQPAPAAPQPSRPAPQPTQRAAPATKPSTGQRFDDSG